MNHRYLFFAYVLKKIVIVHSLRAAGERLDDLLGKERRPFEVIQYDCIDNRIVDFHHV